MENSPKQTDTTPTALQSTSVAITRPKLIIGGAFILVLIVILLEIYAPRSKTDTQDMEFQQDTTTIPATSESSADGITDQNP